MNDAGQQRVKRVAVFKSFDIRKVEVLLCEMKIHLSALVERVCSASRAAARISCSLFILFAPQILLGGFPAGNDVFLRFFS